VSALGLSVHPNEAIAVFISLARELPAASRGLLYFLKKPICQWALVFGKFIYSASTPHLMVVSAAKVASNCVDRIAKPATHSFSPWLKRDYAITTE
jgi:hypothetical protein